jgi:putative transcriptional regulator
MLHAQADWLEESAANTEVAGVGKEVARGIYVGDSACLARASKAGKGDQQRFRVFHGYSGWGPGQLEQEIAAGAWVVAAASPELLFDVPPDDLWDKLSPRRIPEPSVN